MVGITLINPPYIYSQSATSRFTVPPIGLAYIAAALEQEFDSVQLIDAVGSWINQERTVIFSGHPYIVHGATAEQIVSKLAPETRYVGLTCTFSHCWPNTRQLMHQIREQLPHTTLIVGGEHPSSLPEQTLRESDADVVVVGEGEETICALIHALQTESDLSEIQGIACRDRQNTGQILCNAPRARITDIDRIPEPAWHLVPLDQYMRASRFHGPSLGVSMPIMATRGCPYQCTFCTSPQMWTTRWQARDPERVLEEMNRYRRLYGANDFQFVDLTFMIQKPWLDQFCDMLQARGWTDVHWQLPSGTRTEVIDAPLAGKLYQTGCRNISFAPESGSRRMLEMIKKRVNLPHLQQAAKDCVHAGIHVDCFFIIGFPGERIRDIMQTILFMARLAVLGVHGASIATYRALPGTELSRDLESAGLKYSDDVYMSILRSNDFFGSRSWNKSLPGWLLDLFKFAGHAFFYGISFGLRPHRLLRTLRNRMTGTQETKLDRVLARPAL